MRTEQIVRCTWANSDPLMADYHDREWGVPIRDSRALWEMLILEGFQAGLSWQTILKRREGFRAAFAQFDPAKVARFGPDDVDRLMADPGIIRARAKIEATIGNARIYCAIIAQCSNKARISPNGAGRWSAARPGWATGFMSPPARRSRSQYPRT